MALRGAMNARSAAAVLLSTIYSRQQAENPALQPTASELSYAEGGVSDLADGTDCWQCLHFSEARYAALAFCSFRLERNVSLPMISASTRRCIKVTNPSSIAPSALALCTRS